MRKITHRLFSTGIFAAATVGVALPALVWAQDNVQGAPPEVSQEVPQEGQVQVQVVDGSQLGQQTQTTQSGIPVEPVQPNAAQNQAWPGNAQAGTAETNMQGVTPTTTAEANVRQPMTLRNEVFALRPNAGAMVFHDITNSSTTRAIYGLTADWNLAGAMSDNSSLFLGLSSGGLFSHLGSATSDFWGSSASSVVNSPGANMVLIPADLKVGVNMSDAVRISARGGGNVIYRSEGVSMNVGPSTATTSPIWRIYPNIGGDLDIGLTRGLTLGFRPDYTFTPGADIFVGTMALGLSIG